MGNIDDNLEIDVGYIPYDISKTSIAAHYVLCDILVQELMRRDLEWPTLN